MAKRGKAAASRDRRVEVIGLVLVALGVFLAICLLIGKDTGLLGGVFRKGLYGLLGALSYFVLPLLVWMGISMIRQGAKGKWKPKAGQIILWAASLLFLGGLYHLFFEGAIGLAEKGFFGGIGVSWQYSAAHPGLGSGVFGSLVAWPLLKLVGKIGAYIVTVTGLIGSAAFLFNLSLKKAAEGIEHTAKNAGHAVKRGVVRVQEHAAQRRQEQQEARAALYVGQVDGGEPEESRQDKKSGRKLRLFDELEVKPEPPAIVKGLPTIGEEGPLGPGREGDPALFWEKDMFDGNQESGQAASKQPAAAPNREGADGTLLQQEPVDVDQACAQAEAGYPISGMEPPPPTDYDVPYDANAMIWQDIPDIPAPEEITPPAPVKAAPSAAEAAPIQGNTPAIPDEEQAPAARPYRFPPTTLLAQPPRPTAGEDPSGRARVLEETLKNFDISAKVVSVSRGPSITRFELQPAPGVRVGRISALADDLALGLAAEGIRIEAPVPGKSVVGIEVPNRDISTVYIREIIEGAAFKQAQRLPVALGKDIAGAHVVADLTRMPHLLIAGQTGSGKSVCINTILTSLLYRVTPQDMQLIMIDPKVVELSMYNGIPHLKYPVVTDAKKAAGTLGWVVNEMENRYHLFEKRSVRDLARYNEVIQEEGGDKLPFLLVIVDEMADLMVVARNEVEESITRIAQMGRAAGIHLLVATQRPSVNVITGIIKANIPSRIAFATAAQVDSRTILDMAGAEKLLGRGDMLYYPSGASKPTRVQGCYVSDKEVEQVVAFLKNQFPEPEYDHSIADFATAAALPKEDKEDEDELLPQALMIVAETGQASTSLLQRRMRVGYARAGRLIYTMESKGYIGPAEGTKPREVYISREQARMMNQQADMGEDA
nr:DNA translocase FtsK [bacterium]